MNAALYTSRANMKTLMIEKECPGGKMLKTKVIENYIGGNSDSFKLSSDMFAQSIKFGAKYKIVVEFVEVSRIEEKKQALIEKLIKIEGDYATLENIIDGEELFIAMALLPENIDIGTRLHYEMLEYTVID